MTKIYKAGIDYNEYNPTDKDLEKTCKNTYSTNEKR